MSQANRKPGFYLAAGGIAGLLLGLAVAVGIFLGRFSSHPAEAIRLNATASHGASSFAMATGPIDDTVEGLFCLDFVTGDLTCYVLNPRTGRGAGLYKTNVTADLAPERERLLLTPWSREVSALPRVRRATPVRRFR